jgi:hypothetical protein
MLGKDFPAMAGSEEDGASTDQTSLSTAAIFSHLLTFGG